MQIQIPQNWQKVKLEEITEKIYSGGTPNTTIRSYWNGRLNWLSSGETGQRFIYDTKQKITEEGVKNSSTKLAKKGDVVIASAGQGNTRGQVSYLKTDTYINQSVICVRGREDVLDSSWIFYNLSNRYKELRIISDTTSIRGSLTTKIFNDLDILFPVEIKEQQKVVSILSAFDDKIEINNKIAKTLEQMAQNIFKEWFVKFRFPGHEKVKFVDSELGKIPEGWKVEKVGEIVKRLPFGRTYKEENVEKSGKIPVYDQSSTTVLGYHNNKPDFVANITTPYVIFGDHTCRMELLIKSFSLGSNVVPFVGYCGYPTTFVYFLTKNTIKQREYKRHWKEFSEKIKIISSIKIAQDYVRFINQFILKLDIIDQENQKLAAMRDLLLPKLMRGEIRV